MKFQLYPNCKTTLTFRQVKFLTSAEILAKLVAYGNIKKPIGIRALNAILDKHGFPRTRRGNRKTRGYMVVELEATDINSARSIANCDLPF